MGREARLELVFERRRGRTVLRHAYVEPPFRVGGVFDLDDAAGVILACTGPGVCAGDTLRQQVRIGAGARVVLASQSALQVHPGSDRGPRRPAHVVHDYHVEADGELHAHWDPVIPFAGARLVQRFDVRASTGGRVYWSDALMSGRVSRGERWQFAMLDHELRIAVGGILKYVERYAIDPQARAPSRRWVAGEAQYLGTTLVCHERATQEAAERIHRELAGCHPPGAGRFAAAIDVAEPGVMVARMSAAGGVPFANVRLRCRELLLRDIFRAPRLIVRR